MKYFPSISKCSSDERQGGGQKNLIWRDWNCREEWYSRDTQLTWNNSSAFTDFHQAIRLHLHQCKVKTCFNGENFTGEMSRMGKGGVVSTVGNITTTILTLDEIECLRWSRQNRCDSPTLTSSSSLERGSGGASCFLRSLPSWWVNLINIDLNN